MLSVTDLNKIFTGIKKLVREELEEALGLESGQTLDDKLSHLPSKDLFLSENDKLMTELKAIREEQATLSQHDKDQFDRLEKLEKLHPKGQHAFAS